ncbi:hypothetical protein [Companilactobacillus mishanensis]|uniref:Uncharacterized protein n=1 Tax=Companilactobacillus mishanensis TaxID=2486008 RepID=A0A5P0ZLL0_9LACO|nr:hypothetical protein [Companilactobacillus mishanensis]MQS53557.1 hypothetical protein [Companilactobacillus mishanensis]
MTKRGKISACLIILVITICLGSITFGIKTFFMVQEEHEEQIHKLNEMNIVDDMIKNYTGIESVTFTYVESNNVTDGYTYSFFLNDENYKINYDYLWSYTILGDKKIASKGYPSAGKYSFKPTKDSNVDIPTKYLRSKPLQKANIDNLKIKYRLKADK